MQIKVLKTTKAASCKLGIKSKEYIAGETVEIFDELAQVFIKEGWGVKVEEAKLEEKSFDKVLENKAFGNIPENKSIKKKGKK